MPYPLCRIGVSEDDVAGLARMDRSYISDVERGQASLSVQRLLRICAAMQVSAAEIVRQVEVSLKTKH
jgi:transcriptional regulator with XRE-family HTH domain